MTISPQDDPGITGPPPFRMYPSAAAIPIETRYAGFRFRSRLEARWAVFFNELGIKWQYEPEGFTIGSRRYLPDFLLECGTWVEVKGTHDDLNQPLMRAAAHALPRMPASDEPGPKLLILGPLPQPYVPAVQMSGDWGWLGLDPDGRGDELLFEAYGFGNFARNRRPWWLDSRTSEGNWLVPSFHEWEWNTAPAYEAASCAQFEHGKSGAR